jgi:hypothetical protein
LGFLLGKSLLGFMVAQSHVQDIINLLSIFFSKALDILDLFEQVLIKNLIGTTDQVINRYAKFISEFFGYFNRRLDLVTLIPSDDRCRRTYLLG